jgi:hypothetical protein
MTAASDYKENHTNTLKISHHSNCKVRNMFDLTNKCLKNTPSYLPLQAALITDTEQLAGGTNIQPTIGDGD